MFVMAGLACPPKPWRRRDPATQGSALKRAPQDFHHEATKGTKRLGVLRGFVVNVF
jgi:hypothetical protein